MPHKPEKLLTDAMAASEAILSFLKAKNRSAYSEDLLLRSGVERQLEILGEAIRRLDQLAPDLAGRISEHKRIIAFRNVIAHGYDGLDDDVVWQVVTEKVPRLKVEIEDILQSLKSS